MSTLYVRKNLLCSQSINDELKLVDAGPVIIINVSSMAYFVTPMIVNNCQSFKNWPIWNQPNIMADSYCFHICQQTLHMGMYRYRKIEIGCELSPTTTIPDTTNKISHTRPNFLKCSIWNPRAELQIFRQRLFVIDCHCLPHQLYYTWFK